MTLTTVDEQRPGCDPEPGRRPSRRGWRSVARLVPVAVVAVLVGVGLAAVAAAFMPALVSGRGATPRANPAASRGAAATGLRGDAVWGPGARGAPGFTLPDQDGRLVSLAGQRGHVALVTFLSSRCRGMCPLEARQLAEAVRLLPRGQRPVLLVVSVDPRDTARSITSFMTRSGLATQLRWHWLVGTAPALGRVWRAYGIDVQPSTGDVGHSVVTYLVDRAGDERSGYLTPLRVRDLAHDVRELAAGR